MISCGMERHLIQSWPERLSHEQTDGRSVTGDADVGLGGVIDKAVLEGTNYYMNQAKKICIEIAITTKIGLRTSGKPLSSGKAERKKMK